MATGPSAGPTPTGSRWPASQLGLTVDEVVAALMAHDQDGATCASERWRLEQVEARIDAQRAARRRTRRLIRDTLAECDSGQCRLVRR